MLLNLIFRWFWHFDDDDYVNIPVLMKTHVYKDKFYLGRFPTGYWGRNKVPIVNVHLQDVCPCSPSF